MSVENDVDLTLWEPLPEIPNCPEDLRGYAVTSVRDTVYLCGGCTGTWSNHSPVPSVSDDSQNGSKGKFGALKNLGKKSSSKSSSSSRKGAGGKGVQVHRSVMSLNLTTRQWKLLPDMNYHRWGHRLAVLEGGRYIFAIGGWGYKVGGGSGGEGDIHNAHNAHNAHDANDDAKSDNGSTTGSIRSGISGVTTSTVNHTNGINEMEHKSRRKSMNPFGRSKVNKEPNPADDATHVSTGSSGTSGTASSSSSSPSSSSANFNHQTLQRLTSYEIYDTTKQIWKVAGNLNVSRRDFAVAVDATSGKIYAIGGTGCDEDDNNGNNPNGGGSGARYSIGNAKGLNSIEVYNPHVNEWTLLKPMPHAKRWCHAVIVGGKIHVFETGRGMLVYDIQRDEWSEEGGGVFDTVDTGITHGTHGGVNKENQDVNEEFENENGSLEVYPKAYNGINVDSHDYSDLLPKCPPRGKVCASASFTGGGGEVLVFGYPVKEMDGRWSDRWMITHINTHHLHHDTQNGGANNRKFINSNRSKSWTVLPPADEFMYYRTAVADGKLVIVIGNTLIAFEIVDETDDLNSVAQEEMMGSVSPSSRASSYSENGSMYCGSQLTSGSERSVEPIKDDGTWKRQPDISSDKPPDFRGYAVTSADNHIYISGGVSGQGTVYRSFLSYDVTSKKWHKLPGMTHRRLGHKMAVITDEKGEGRYIYALGGGDGKTLRSMGVDIYDVEKRMWTAAPAMNNYRVFFGYTVCRNKIFVFGGVGSNNGNQLASVEVYDPKRNGWEFGRSMPEARGVCNVITVKDVIYVFGTPSQKVLAYDTRSDRWLDEEDQIDAVILESAPLPSCPPGGCVCASSSYIGGEVLVLKYPLGGPQSAHRRTAQVYDAKREVWSSVHLLDEFACYSAVVAGKKLVVVTPQNHLQACTLPSLPAADVTEDESRPESPDPAE